MQSVNRPKRSIVVCAVGRSRLLMGDAAMISGYCGTGDVLPDAIGKFSLTYLEQTERDHGALEAAARRGRISVAGRA